MIEPTKPLIAREYKPAACQEADCSYSIEPIKEDRPGSAGAFVHECGGVAKRYFISERDLADIDCDIWGEQVKPWIERIHAERRR